MKNLLQVFFLSLCITLLFPSNSFAQHAKSNEHFKILIHEATVDLPIEKVWWGWTTDEGVQSFLAADSEIDFQVGGHYNLALYEKSSQVLKENKILSFIPYKMFSFEFAMPDQFASIQQEKTWVVVELTPRSAKETDVKITHLGWGKGGDWEAAYNYFQETWLQAVAHMQSALPERDNSVTTEKKPTTQPDTPKEAPIPPAQSSKYSPNSSNTETPEISKTQPQVKTSNASKNESIHAPYSPKTPPTMQQFAYLLSLNDPELARNPDAWTKEQSAIINVHFNYLKKLTDEGTVIMAGRSPDPEKGFGIVILQAPSREVAQEIMYSDPAVKNKLMSAEFHDFRVALMTSERSGVRK